MKVVNASNYRQDKYYPAVVRAVAAILARSDVVAPVDVLLEMGCLDKRDLEAWRHGRVAFLEKVLAGNLSKASRVLRLLALQANDLEMRPSHTAYHQWGKGIHRQLRFSKSGKPIIESAYSRHFLWTKTPEAKQAAIARLNAPKPGRPAPESVGGPTPEMDGAAPPPPETGSAADGS